MSGTSVCYAKSTLRFVNIRNLMLKPDACACRGSFFQSLRKVLAEYQIGSRILQQVMRMSEARDAKRTLAVMVGFGIQFGYRLESVHYST